MNTAFVTLLPHNSFMSNSYGKEEKLKSKTVIDSLFSEGKSVAKYPLRFVYRKVEGQQQIKVGVSVSKKYFKKATDRNYFKRLLREAYRTQKWALGDADGYAIMIFYQTTDRLTHQEVCTRMQHLIDKFNRAEGLVNKLGS